MKWSSMEIHISYYNGSQVEFSKILCISVVKICSIFVNSANVDEMSHKHLDRRLSKYLVGGIQNEKG